MSWRTFRFIFLVRGRGKGGGVGQTGGQGGCFFFIENKGRGQVKGGFTHGPGGVGGEEGGLKLFFGDRTSYQDVFSGQNCNHRLETAIGQRTFPYQKYYGDQEWLRQTKPKKVRFENFPGSPEFVPEPPFWGALYSIYKQKGVPEPVPDSVPESS